MKWGDLFGLVPNEVWVFISLMFLLCWLVWLICGVFNLVSYKFALTWFWTGSALILLLIGFGDLIADLKQANKVSLGYFYGVWIGTALAALLVAYPISWVVIGLGKFQKKFEPRDDD